MGTMPAPSQKFSESARNDWSEEREALLQQRIDELGLTIEGTRLEPLTQQLYRELEQAGISLKPPVYLSDEWGCPEGESSPQWTPQYTKVTHAVVHHTAGANSVPDWDAEVRSIWHLHTFDNGWGDIGYNYLIDPNGVIYEGRAGGDGAIGAHFSCRNTNTVGIALLGTYIDVMPTSAALASLENLLAELCQKNAIVPLSTA